MVLCLLQGTRAGAAATGSADGRRFHDLRGHPAHDDTHTLHDGDTGRRSVTTWNHDSQRALQGAAMVSAHATPPHTTPRHRHEKEILERPEKKRRKRKKERGIQDVKHRSLSAGVPARCMSGVGICMRMRVLWDGLCIIIIGAIIIRTTASSFHACRCWGLGRGVYKFYSCFTLLT